MKNLLIIFIVAVLLTESVVESAKDTSTSKKSSGKIRNKEQVKNDNGRQGSGAKVSQKKKQSEDYDENKNIKAAKHMFSDIPTNERLAMKSFFTRATNKLPKDDCAFTAYFDHISALINLVVRKDGTLIQVTNKKQEKSLTPQIKEAVKNVETDYRIVESQIKSILKQLVQHMKDEVNVEEVEEGEDGQEEESDNEGTDKESSSDEDGKQTDSD